MLYRIAMGTQKVEQRINSEVKIIVLLKPMSNPLGVNSLCSLLPFTRANAKWVIHGFK